MAGVIPHGAPADAAGDPAAPPLIGAGAAHWLAAWLAWALPDLMVLDLAALQGGGLLPWWTGPARWGVADPATLAAAERDLLRFFRHADGTPLHGVGLDREAGEDGGSPDLVVLPAGAPPERWLAAGAMILGRGPAPPACLRVMLLIGAPAPVESLDLLLPEGGPGEALLAALGAAAQAGLPGAQLGLRRISPRLAALTLLAPAPPPLVIPMERLPRAEAGPGRWRVLLGTLPDGARLRLPGLPAGTAVLVDGVRCADGEGPPGAVTLHPGPAPCVLGLAGPEAHLPDLVEIGVP